jgi:sorbitol-specific phosphotransferase system component IIA
MESNKEALQIQESIVNLLIRISALEKLLLKNNLLTVEDYQKTIIAVGKEVNEKLQEQFNQLQNVQEKEKED